MYFFTDPNKLSPQSAVQGFGPVPTDVNSQYAVTSRFTAQAGALAYSVVAGLVMIQPCSGHPDKVNLILKPLNGKNGGYTSVEFIIYKGLKKSSFITGNGASEQLAPASTSEFIAQIWSVWQSIIADFTAIPGTQLASTPPLDYLGWQFNSLLEEKLVTDGFDSFTSQSQLFAVSEGIVLGEFDTTISFGIEVVLKEPLYLLKFGDARSLYTVFSVTIPANIDQWHESAALKRKREQVVAFLDPCLYFLLNADEGVKYKNNGSEQTATGREEVYNNCVQSFLYKDKIYLDVRNEVSHSLDFFGDNNNAASAGNSASEMLIGFGSNLALRFASSPWPLHRVDANAHNQISIQFYRGYNPEPLIYIEYGFSNDFEFHPIVSSERFFGPASSNLVWSLPVTLALPVLANSANCGWIVKLMVLRKRVPTNIPATALPRLNKFDNIFGPTRAIDTTFTSGTILLGKRWLYLGSDELDVKGVIVEVSLFFSGTQVSILGNLVDTYLDFAIASADIPGFFPSNRLPFIKPTVEQVSQTILRQAIANEFGLDMVRVEATIQGVGIVNISGFPQLPGFPRSNYLVGIMLSRQQYDAYAFGATQLFDNDVSETYLQLTGEQYAADQMDRVVISREVTLGGIANNTYYLASGLTASDSTVRSYDSLRFSSNDFASTITSRIAERQLYTWNNFVDDVIEVEKVYTQKLQRDTNAHETVTRIRVHYYGWQAGVNGYVEEGSALAFNYALPLSPYWESATSNPSDCNVTPSEFNVPGSIPYFDPAFDRFGNCRARGLYVAWEGQPELSINVKERLTLKSAIDNGSIITDKFGLKIDIGHTFYSLDALLISPNSAPAYAFRELGATSSFDYANLLGDLTGVVTTAYAQRIHLSSSAWAAVNWNTVLEEQYKIAAPLSDILSDTDGVGLFKAWQYLTTNTPTQQVRLSDVLQLFYGGSGEYSCDNRWKTYCLHENIISKLPSGAYSWHPLNAGFQTRFDNAWIPAMLAETYKPLVGIFLFTHGTFPARDIVRFVAKPLYSNHRDKVLDIFIQNTRAALNAEQRRNNPNWVTI